MKPEPLIYWAVADTVVCRGMPITVDESRDQLEMLNVDILCAVSAQDDLAYHHAQKAAVQLIHARIRARRWVRASEGVR